MLLSGLVLLIGSCKDIIEKDISGDVPVVILPTVNDSINANPVQIKWEKMDGATKYHLQIVSPSFSSIDVYALDSIVTGTSFYIALDSNRYELKITALNAGYESYTTAAIPFWVGVSASSGTNGVTLLGPSNAAYFNENFQGQFSWNTVSNLQNYTFELHQGASFSGAYVGSPVQLNSVSYTIPDPDALEEGQYTWGVKAFYTDGSESAFSKRTFYIDTTNPGMAGLLSPASNASMSQGPVLFTWNFPTDNGAVGTQSPVEAIVEVASDVNFLNIVSSSGWVDDNQTTISFNTPGIYYWRVRLRDEASNQGLPSSYFILNIN